MLAAIQGFICGILLAIICQAVLLYRFVLSLQSDRLFPATNGDAKRATPAADHPEALAPWPEQIVSQIKAALEPSSLDSQQQEAWPQAMSPTIEADWVNVYLCRYFLALRSSSIFREKWAAIMCRSINLKLKGNSFVSRVDIADLYLGDNAPTITGLRLAKGATEDLALEMHGDVIYLGGASLKVVVNMSSGSQVPIQVYISAFSGTVCVRIPHVRYSDRLSFAFLRDPGLTFRVEAPVNMFANETIRGATNKLLTAIFRRAFLDLFVRPSEISVYLPMMEQSSRDIANQQVDTSKPAPERTHIASQLAKGARLFSSRNQTIETLGDGIPLTFDISLTMPMDDPDVTTASSRALIDAFLTYVAEPARPTEPHKEHPGPTEIPDGLYGQWKEIKSKNGIHVHRKQIRIGVQPAELHRGVIPIECDASRVIGVLSNPRHLQHIHESFVKSQVLHQESGHTVHNCTFQIQKSTRSFLVFQVQEPENLDESDNHRGTVIVMRSITGFTGGTDAQTKNEVDQKVIANNENQENRRLHASEVNLSGPSTLRESIETSASMRRRRPPAPPMPTFSEGRSDSNGLESSHSLDAIRQSVAARSGTPLRPGSTPENSAVYVFGYYIQPSPTNPENACLVTCITNLSPDLKPLEVDYHTCKKLKLFIEELVHLTASLDDPNSGHIKRKVFDDVNMDKIKSYIGNTANYFMTAKHKLGVDSHINSLKSLFARPSDPEPPLKADEHEGPIHAPPLPPRALSIEAAFQKMAAPATSPIAPYVNAETGEIVPDISPLSSSPIAPPPILHETATPKPLADIEDGFIERPIMPKEILRIELVFDAQTQPDACLVWEYISILEQCPLFGIFFIPESRSPLLASSLESSAQILVPLTECQAFTRAAHGHIPLTHLSSGTIILHWDNLTPLHRSFPKQIAYRAEITESPAQSVSEWTMNVTIVRKSRYTLPMLVSACSSLRVSFTTNAPISFCVEYVPHTGEKQVLDERNESKTEFSLGLNGLDGVINLHWDNMASIVSSRQVSYNIQLEST